MRTRGLSFSMAIIVALGSQAAFGRIERIVERREAWVGLGRPVFRRGVVVVDRRHGPGWGAVAGATAAGLALGAAATAAAASRPQTVVETPVMGVVVPALPPGCIAIPAAGGVLYNCNSVFYQPVYYGGTIMYQVVRPR